MVALRDWPISEWTSDGTVPWGGFRAGLEPAIELSVDDILASEVRRVRALLIAAASEISWLRAIQTKAGSDATITGFESEGADALLRRLDGARYFVSATRNRLEPLSAYIAKLERVRRSGSVWSSDAESLLGELLGVRDVLIWAEAAGLGWSAQLHAEIERRNHDLPPLPFEPLDLGPSDSARLPQVL